MAIPQEEYIQITSGVVADAVSNRELIGRVLTESPICPNRRAEEFTSLASVGTYFGYSSDEYAFAQRYFNFLSKDIKKPKKISFFRIVKPTSEAGSGNKAFVRFAATETAAPSFQTIEGDDAKSEENIFTISYKDLDTDQSVNYQISYPPSGTDISTWAEFVAYVNSVAVLKEYPIELKFQASPFYLYIEFNTTDNIGNIAVASSDDWLNGVLNSYNIASGGKSAPATWSEFMDYVDDTSNNFGTFTILDEGVGGYEDVEAAVARNGEIARWNMGKNVKYMYVLGVTKETYNVFWADLKEVDGTWLQLLDQNTNYAKFAPMAIGATFNYNQANTNAFFDFYPIADFPAQVTTKTFYDLYVAARINFNGQTQQAGQTIDFLQPGYLTGSISDAGVYYNEMWIKDDIWTKLMNLFLLVKKIPANEAGIAQCKGTIMTTINQALINGSILIGKTLTNAQKAQIQEMTNNPDAVNAIQNNGYYLNLWVTRTTENGTEKYIVEYQLLYAKGDGIRKVEGTDVLY